MGKELKAYLWLVICMWVQVVSVFPHHHHAEKFCVQEDWYEVSDDEASGHPCDGTCITKFQYFSSESHLSEAGPDYSFYRILYPLWAVLWMIFFCPEAKRIVPVFRERLYTRAVARITGLRAPPAFHLSLLYL